MNKLFTENAWEDLVYWINTDKKLVKKIEKLLKDIERTPFEGIGKPEPLKHDLAGKWSRRISQEHRLIYEIDSNNNLIVYACRYRY